MNTIPTLPGATGIDGTVSVKDRGYAVRRYLLEQTGQSGEVAVSAVQLGDGYIIHQAQTFNIGFGGIEISGYADNGDYVRANAGEVAAWEN